VKTVILAEAESEIDEARKYLNRQSPHLGDRFVNVLADQLDNIATHPHSFPKLETLPNDQPYRRALLLPFGYALIYEVAADEIVVTAVAHGSRRPNYWLGRTR
jgi:toxin ParE1/3/4